MIKGTINITMEEDGKRFAIHQDTNHPSVNCVRAIRKDKNIANLKCGKYHFTYDEETDTVKVD